MHGQKNEGSNDPTKGLPRFSKHSQRPSTIQQSSAGDIDTFTHRPWYAHTWFSHWPFYTQTLLHTNTFTHRPFYTQTYLDRDDTGILKAKKRPFLKPKNRQFAGVSVFFEESRSKKHRKKPCFLTPRKPKTTVFTVFFAPGTKNHGIYSVLWPAPCKNSGIYAVFSMLHEVLFPCQKPKNTVNYSVLAFDTRWKTSEKRQKTTKSVQNWTSLSTFKNEGSGASFFWALPRQAQASPSQNGPKSEPSPPHTPQTSFASLIPILSPGLRLAFVT